MKQMNVIFREKLVVEYWELISMESGCEVLVLQDIASVGVAEEWLAAKKQGNSWRTEENWPRLKKALVNSQYPYLRGQCDEACLELGLDSVHKQTVFNVLAPSPSI